MGGKDHHKLEIGTLFEKYFRFWAAHEKITNRAAGARVLAANDREELEQQMKLGDELIRDIEAVSMYPEIERMDGFRRALKTVGDECVAFRKKMYEMLHASQKDVV